MIAARDTDALLTEITVTKKRFGLPENAAVSSSYEAVRSGFWLHRFLTSKKIENRSSTPRESR
jgi:hypothetical protein